MGVEWYVNFVHPDETFRPSAEIFEKAKELLGSLGRLALEQVATPQGTVRRSMTTGLVEKVEGDGDSWASFRPYAADVPFCDYSVNCYAEPTSRNENDGVPYTTTFEVTLTFDANKELAAETPDIIEQKIREYMGGVLEKIEELVGARLLMTESVEG